MTQSALLSHIIEVAGLPANRLPAAARQMARLSLFDWITVSVAGADQPLAGMIRDFVGADGGTATATIVGSDLRLPARAAALANGTISHALDYDDTHFAYIGHPSVAIYPAALAAAEDVGASGTDLVDAFLVGAEAACRIGMVLGRDHYDAGFHQTATSGAFGATVAASRLYGLDAAALRAALGLVSSRASGLKSQFGTMGKPFNAGAAAANGIEAAGLARRGFTAADDAFDGPQSFLVSHHARPDGAALINDLDSTQFVFADVRHKLHACCHGTHAMIEALLLLRAMPACHRDQIAQIRVHTAPRWLNVCDIKTPRTGLEIKFSYVFLAAMVMRGVNLAAYESYDDRACDDPALQALAARVEIIGDDTIADSGTRVEIVCDDKAHLEQSFDLLAPLDPDQLGQRLLAKSAALLGDERAADLWAAITNLDHLSAADIARQLRR